MKTVILWYRNDLRVHDLPALAAAAEADRVVPVFIFDKTILEGKGASSNRHRFLLECLEDLKASLSNMGSNLYVREGQPEKALQQLAKEADADSIYYTIDYTPYSIKRDTALKHAMDKQGIAFTGYPGRLAVDSLKDIKTKSSGTVVKVFTPFWKQWMDIPRRDLVTTPQKLNSPSNLTVGSIPSLASLTKKTELSPDVSKGGETAGRQRLNEWLKAGIQDYHQGQNDMSQEGTSRLSPYLHLGCLSLREIEQKLPDNKGARAWHRQLAWRDFYHYILLNYPKNLDQELQERYRSMNWSTSKKALEAWQQGQTGYPLVDASMRQLNNEGWMHNRGRLVVGSFLTKDLHLDWRAGQAYFMKMLLDGDNPNNNGNWQWIAGTGVDPAPVFRRLYNPSSQATKFDPAGTYIRRYVPELQHVPDKYLAEPWTMSAEQQKEAKCTIGKDYPKPIVDHKTERQVALDRYRSTA